MEFKLKECLEKVIDNRGKNPNYEAYGEYPIIDNVLIKNNLYPNISEATRFINSETYNNFLRGYIEKDMPIMTLVGSGIGNVSLAPSNKCAIVQNTIGFKVKDNILDNKYLYYWFLTKQLELKNLNRGSGQPSIKKTDVEELKIDIPILDIQRKVVKVLFNIDKKIQLNNKMNDNLQEIMQCKYKEILSNQKSYNAKISDIIKRNKKKINNYDEWKNEKLIDLSVMPQFSICLNEFNIGDKVTSNIYKLKQGNILYGSIRPYFGKVGISPIDGVVTGTVFNYNGIDEKYDMYLLAITSSIEFINYTVKVSKGTKMPVVDWNDFVNYDIYIPKDDELGEFNMSTKAAVNKIISNINENSILINLRDTLLQKLMNGEIDLDKIEI